MENESCFLSKCLYKQKLNDLLNEIIASSLRQNNRPTCKVTLADCKQKQHGNTNNYEFMVPQPLVARWKSSYGMKCDDDAQCNINSCLAKLKEATTSWLIPIEDVQMNNSVIFLQANKVPLTEVLISSYIGGNCASLTKPHATANYEWQSLICCLTGAISDIRTLCIASLLHYPHSLIFASKQPLQHLSDVKLISKSLNLNINWDDTVSDADCGSVYEVLEKCKYFCKQNVSDETLGNSGCLQFEDKSSFFQPKEIKDLILKVINTKLHLTTNVLHCISCMYKSVEANLCKSGIDQQRHHFVNIGSQSETLFSRQLHIAFLIYCYYKYEGDLDRFNVICASTTDIFHGPINLQISTGAIIEDYRENVVESFKSKYGENPSWLPLVDTIAGSVLKLVLLETTLTSPISSELASNTASISTRFVLYNYSRISGLLNKYDDCVAASQYPTLPKFGEIDFSLLREDDEKHIVDHLWQLNYLLDRYDEGVNRVDSPNFKPHTLVVYLTHLSRIFSSFYNRHHILGGNLPHLLPTMHARIYLVKALQHAMNLVFARLGIKALDQM